MRGDVLMKANKPQIVAASVTALVHVAVLLFLLLMTIDRPAANREGGVEVMLGNFELAGGDMPGSEATGAEPLPPADEAETGGQSLLTQADEPSAAIDEDPRPEDEERQTPPQKTKEQLQAEHERKVAEEADRLMGSAFAKGSQMTGSGGSGQTAGAKGRPDGSPSGIAASGEGGHGSFSLAGRSLGRGTLPAPSYDVEEEGTVVIDIWVAPSGKVVHTSVNHATNTSSPALRAAAEDAARRAVFNSVPGTDTQRGTITYVFNLR